MLTTSVKNEILQLSKVAASFRPSLELNALENMTATKLGGKPYAEYLDEWPACGVKHCGDPMGFVFQFRDREVDELNVFYYCQTCNDTCLRSDSWEVRNFIFPTQEKFHACEPPIENELVSDYVNMTSSKVTTSPTWASLPSHSQSIPDVCRSIDGQFPMDQYYSRLPKGNIYQQPQNSPVIVGGHGFWPQSVADTQCTKCKRPNEFAAQVNYEPTYGNDWPMQSNLYLMRCPFHTDHFELVFQCH